MTTNIDRAAEIIEDLIDEPHMYPDGGMPDAAAQALADDRLLMPDLPEPTIWRSGKEPRWIACDTEIEPAGYEQRVLVHDVDISWDIGADDARDLAYALLAAADYTERNQA